MAYKAIVFSILFKDCLFVASESMLARKFLAQTVVHFAVFIITD